jgi:tRNA(Arg) A34 adenosine deaminase TadA
MTYSGSSRHLKFFEIAKKNAFKSNGTHKHGACIVYRNKVIGEGCNIYYSSLLGKKNRPHNSIHAEISTINSVRDKSLLKYCVLYVVRINPSGVLRNSEPCKSCSDIINKFKFRNVYYSL